MLTGNLIGNTFLSNSLRILHCLRAPVGGLFRHVYDLASAQVDMGHETGIICDSSTDDATASDKLSSLSDLCTLGVHRIAMNRGIGFNDFFATRAVRKIARLHEVDIIHGHGAKGGAYARLAAAGLKRKGQNIATLYTPHGGSLHYSPGSLPGKIFMALERRLGGKTDGLIFESAYSGKLYQEKIGPYPCLAEVIPNGLAPDEFYETALDIDAADFLFIGELRHLKGIDVLLEAIARLSKEKPDISVFIVGAGPDEITYRRMTKRLGLISTVTFAGAMPARTAFSRGQCLIMPSRAESFPYIVLEAAAAQLPIIATNVGGIPEIISGTGQELIPPADADALKDQMKLFLDTPDIFIERAKKLQQRVSQRFTITGMAGSITRFYSRVLYAIR